MELDKEEWQQVKAIIKAARSFTKSYEHLTEWPFNGFMFEDLKNAVKAFDEKETV